MMSISNLEIYSSEKIIEFSKAAILSSRLKNSGKKVGLCHGCFDLLHPGHVTHLSSAKSLCDILFVSLTADNFIASKKGRGRPIFSERLRAYMVASLNVTDYVLISNYEKGTEIIELLKPSFYIKGPDIKNLDSPAINEEKEMLEKTGGKIRYTNEPKLATTEIINYIQDYLK